MNLTPRELEVLAAVAHGCSTKTAAKTIGLSYHTCKDYLRFARAKLNAENTTHAVVIAIQRGLIQCRPANKEKA
jgi:DNA-binding NarL/FixJ family response regulator